MLPNWYSTAPNAGRRRRCRARPLGAAQASAAVSTVAHRLIHFSSDIQCRFAAPVIPCGPRSPRRARSSVACDQRFPERRQDGAAAVLAAGLPFDGSMTANAVDLVHQVPGPLIRHVHRAAGPAPSDWRGRNFKAKPRALRAARANSFLETSCCLKIEYLRTSSRGTCEASVPKDGCSAWTRGHPSRRAQGRTP
jgi:hypothetical protein